MSSVNRHDSGIYLTVLNLRLAFRPTYGNRMLMILFFFASIDRGISQNCMFIDSWWF